VEALGLAVDRPRSERRVEEHVADDEVEHGEGQHASG